MRLDRSERYPRAEGRPEEAGPERGGCEWPPRPIDARGPRAKRRGPSVPPVRSTPYAPGRERRRIQSDAGSAVKSAIIASRNAAAVTTPN